MPFCPQCGKKLEEGELCSCPMSVAKRNAANAQGNMNNAGGEVDLVGKISKSFSTLKDNIKDCYEGLFKGKYYEIGENVIPDNVNANDSEIAIKQYDNVARLKSVGKLSWAFGKILLTNKRLIFRAPGYSPISGKTILQYEFALDKLAGFEAKRAPKFSIWDLIGAFFVGSFGGGLVSLLMKFCSEGSNALGLIFGLVLGFLFAFVMIVLANTRHSYWKLLFSSASSTAFSLGMTIARFSDNKFMFILFSVLSVISVIIFMIIMIRVVFPTELILTFNTDGGSRVVDIRRKPWVGVFAFIFGTEPQETFTGFSQVQPDKNTDSTIKELGAILNDIQKFGDFAIEKWKDK